MNDTDRSSLHASIYAYFQWLAASSPPGEKQPVGKRVLQVMEQEFPELVKAGPPSEPIHNPPELQVRYVAYPFHLKRIDHLEKAATGVTPARKRKSTDSASARVAKQSKTNSPPSTETSNQAAAYKPGEAPIVGFDERIEQLQYFQKGYGHARVPRTYKQNPGLGRWVGNIRQIYRDLQKAKARGKTTQHHTLTDDRIALLESVGFEWSGLKDERITWEERFEQLKEYKEEFGHCRVPREWKKNPSLGEWCHTQRKNYHKKAPSLMGERLQKLNEIGFEWLVSNGVQAQSWETRFEQLVDFRRTHGHLNVPPPVSRKEMKMAAENSGSNEDGDTDTGVASVSSEEQTFRKWVRNQRVDYHHRYRQGKKCALDRSRVKKLEEIGFDWGKSNVDYTNGNAHHRVDPVAWNRNLEQLQEYKDIYGHCNVPQQWLENRSLGIWVSEQRKQYKLMMAGKRSSLSLDRKVALENLGFEWVRRRVRQQQDEDDYY